MENDGFNRLLLGAELSARQIVMLRAYCRYLLQAGVPFSQAYMERALGANAGCVEHFTNTRFDMTDAGGFIIAYPREQDTGGCEYWTYRTNTS